MLTSRQLADLRRQRPHGRNRLSQAMRLAKITQEQLADAVGSNQPRISAIANGRYGNDGLPVETARNLADFFGCTIEDLFPAPDQKGAVV